MLSFSFLNILFSQHSLFELNECRSISGTRTWQSLEILWNTPNDNGDDIQSYTVQCRRFRMDVASPQRRGIDAWRDFKNIAPACRCLTIDRLVRVFSLRSSHNNTSYELGTSSIRYLVLTLRFVCERTALAKASKFNPIAFFRKCNVCDHVFLCRSVCPRKMLLSVAYWPSGTELAIFSAIFYSE